MSELLIELEGVIPEKVIVKVRDQLRIKKDLETELDHAAEQFGFYGSLAEKAETKCNRIELAYRLWRAEKEKTILEEHKLEGVKPPTRDQMVTIVRGSPQYKTFKLKVIKYDEDKRILKVLSKAFEKKVETIRTKCSNKRKES